MHGEIREIMIVLKLNGNDLSRNRISKVSVTPDARVFFFFFFFFFFIWTVHSRRCSVVEVTGSVCLREAKSKLIEIFFSFPVVDGSFVFFLFFRQKNDLTIMFTY